jgi:hypothetical protein
MILGHKEEPGAEPYWFGKINGVDKKFARVIAGVILPMTDRQAGCVAVIGELFRGFAAPDFTGLAAAVGGYGQIKRALMEFDRDLQFRDLIVERNELRSEFWETKMPGLSLMIRTATAPQTAFAELGRQRVDELIEQGHLHVELIEDTLAKGETEVTTKAVHAAVMWMLEYPHLYRNSKKRGQPEYQRVWGTDGL